MNIIKRAFDQKDFSVELHDLIGSALILAHTFFAGAIIFVSHQISLLDFGTGAAAIITAMGGAGWMKGRQRAIDPATKDCDHAP